VTVEEMQRELIKLDAESRSEIYCFLMDLMEGDTGFDEEEYDRLWAEECRRRCDEFDRGESRAIPAEQVFAEARALVVERRLACAKELTA
jgi:hypothetical protein